jgi:hypothetical protein
VGDRAFSGFFCGDGLSALDGGAHVVLMGEMGVLASELNGGNLLKSIESFANYQLFTYFCKKIKRRDNVFGKLYTERLD